MGKQRRLPDALSADEAAAILDVTTRRILDYVRAGLLSADPRFRETVLFRDEVENFTRPHGKPGPKPKKNGVAHTLPPTA